MALLSNTGADSIQRSINISVLTIFTFQQETFPNHRQNFPVYVKPNCSFTLVFTLEFNETVIISHISWLNKTSLTQRISNLKI